MCYRADGASGAAGGWLYDRSRASAGGDAPSAAGAGLLRRTAGSPQASSHRSVVPVSSTT